MILAKFVYRIEKNIIKESGKVRMNPRKTNDLTTDDIKMNYGVQLEKGKVYLITRKLESLVLSYRQMLIK